ncbi:zinc finger protein 595-like [Chironomus tepperi]|uniref:zinc finger protein 595-like n=1 Tax=Chironomus tepperi TaxID=113505 RepID=UPI00391F02B9
METDSQVIIEELYDCESDIIEKVELEDDEIVKEQQIYQCSSCNFSFTDVNEHLQKYHDINENIEHQNEEEEMILEELDDESDTEINLAPIVKNEDGKYDCTECQKSFKNYKRFVSHLKSHTGLMVEDYSELEQNVKVEFKHNEYVQLEGTDGTIYRCKQCNADFGSRKSLLLHLSIHKNVSDAQNKEQLFEKQSTDIINCQICNKSFSNKLEFDLHIQAHDENSPSTSKAYMPKKATTAQKGVHPCQYCGKIFKRPHEKVKHERIHSGVKPYTCDLCGKQFRVTYCLSLHKRNVHSDDRPYICTFPGCNKRFKAQSVYNHHINTHSDERKFQCPFCPKTFKTSVQLAGHKNTHTKPFSCQICKRPFSSLYAVKNHMETHNNQDSNLKLTCKICGAQYARSFALKDHIKSVHPEMDVEIEEYIIETDMDGTNGEDNELYSVVMSSE